VNVIPKVGRFLDPIVAVRQNGGFVSPNGMHRLVAMRKLGAKAIVALVVPEPEIAFRILALNTEKAHNLKDKSLEVIRMARALATDEETATRAESSLAFEFEEPAYLTIGMCYEKRPRFSGASYLSVLKKGEAFSDAGIAESLEAREERADKLLAVDDAVGEVIAKLKERGMMSPYLRAFVVARINPLRFVKAKPGQKSPAADVDVTLDKMLASAKKFDVAKVKEADIRATGGPADESSE
jgi:ParB family chromosome partitioning protein